MNIYFGFVVLSINIRFYSCYVAYEIFPGFDATLPTTHNKYGNATISSQQDHVTSTNGTSVTHSTADPRNGSKTVPTTTTSTTPYTLLPVKNTIFNCSEDEIPFNIGPYEVPTQRDMVLHIRKTLISSFNSYQQKALYFLKDIQGATRSTSEIARTCGNQVTYKKCVKRVSVRSQVITKSLVTSLERQRIDVSGFIEGTICKVKEMKADPLQLVKTLAMEEASLEFALPGFLRLLGACTVYCERKQPRTSRQKPLRHMSDQDLVVKHFLTKKTYLQLIKSSK